MVKRKAFSFIDMIERADDLFEDQRFEESYNFASNLTSKIKKFRKSGLEDKGEYSNENLTFKFLRNHKYIDHIYKLRDDSYDRMMSLGGRYHRKFKIFMSQEEKEEKKGFHRLDELAKYQKKAKKPNYKCGKSSLPGFGGFDGKYV